MYTDMRGLVNKEKDVYTNQKGKGKVTICEIKDKMKNTWVRKSNFDVENGPTPKSASRN